MKKLFFLFVALLSLFTVSGNAKKFYDSKSQIIGISGDIKDLVYGELKSKYFINDIKIDIQDEDNKKFKKKFKKSECALIVSKLNRENVGKKILDYLFCYDGRTLSEHLLRKRALKNVQLIDEERATRGVIDPNMILQEDYLPILENNYIVKTRKYEKKIYWIVFRVGINKNILEEVFNSWSNMDKYNAIKVPIEYVASGSYKDKRDSNVKNQLAYEISRKIAAFSVRGQIIDNHPLILNIGEEEGVKKGSRIAIFRQSANDKGEYKSKRIAYARAATVKDTTRMFRISGKATSYKKGDIGVLDFDRGMGSSITGTLIRIKDYGSTYYGCQYNSDKRVFFNKKGFSTYTLLSIGLYASDQDIKNTSAPTINDGAVEFDSTPKLMDIGVGIGIGKTFLSRLELMPYIKACYSFALGDEDDYDDFTKLIRIPVGICTNINLFYPFQLTCGFEYSLLTLSADAESNFGDSDTLKSFGGYIGFRILF